MTSTHLIYLVISLMITVIVGRTLFKHGRPFLLDVFHKPQIADAVNHLLLIGFYLVNIAFVTLALRLGNRVHNLSEAIELLATKLGIILVVLGIMHFANMITFAVLKSRRMLN